MRGKRGEGRAKRGAQRTSFSFMEYVILFLAVALVATVSIFSSTAIDEASGGNTAVTPYPPPQYSSRFRARCAARGRCTAAYRRKNP